jgi:uncharacterized protein (DUF1810 family)
MNNPLERFIEAQNTEQFGSSFKVALNELNKGKKKSHWIWYIFPQLSHPKARSANAVRFALINEEEALEYLKNPLLSDRYLMVLEAMHSHSKNKSLLSIMGSQTDLDKLFSSLNLFEKIAYRLKNLDPKYEKIHQLCHSLLEKSAPPNPIILELNEFIARHHQQNIFLYCLSKLKEFIYLLSGLIFGTHFNTNHNIHPEISAAHKLIAFLEHRPFSPLTAEEICCFEQGELYQLQEKYPIESDFFAHRVTFKN